MTFLPCRTVAFCAAAASLFACAPAPLAVSSSGSLPASGTIALADEGAAAEYAPLVLRELQARGLALAQDADYLVQVAVAGRPRGSGLYLPEQPERWLRNPARAGGGGSAPTLILTLSECGSGREVYRASVVAPSKSAAAPARLVASILPESGSRD